MLGSYRGRCFGDLPESTQVAVLAYQRIRRDASSVAPRRSRRSESRPMTAEDARWILSAPVSLADTAYLAALKHAKPRPTPMPAAKLAAWGLPPEDAAALAATAREEAR